MNDPVETIQIEAVSHQFGDRQVLNAIDLTLVEHRVGIVGLNGSGKSTLARLLNGLVVPDQGRVRVHGHDTRDHGAEVRRLVGFVFTDADAQIVMPTVAEDVAFSLRQRARRAEPSTTSTTGTTRTARSAPRRLFWRRAAADRDLTSDAELHDQVRAALTTVGLDGHADHPAHLLSGGQKQLLALTSVLVTNPQIIVFDEPTTLLDARNARMIGARIEDLPQQVVMVTHHTDMLLGFERVLVIDRGRVVADDEPVRALRTFQRLIDQ